MKPRRWQHELQQSQLKKKNVQNTVTQPHAPTKSQFQAHRVLKSL